MPEDDFRREEALHIYRHGYCSMQPHQTIGPYSTVCVHFESGCVRYLRLHIVSFRLTSPAEKSHVDLGSHWSPLQVIRGHIHGVRLGGVRGCFALKILAAPVSICRGPPSQISNTCAISVWLCTKEDMICNYCTSMYTA